MLLKQTSEYNSIVNILTVICFKIHTGNCTMGIKLSLGKVLPHLGVSTIQFGLKRQEVIDVLGEPSAKKEEKIDEDDGNEKPDIVFEYEDLGLSFAFDSEYSYRLSYIESEREDVSILGVGLFNSPLDEVVFNLSEEHTVSEISGVEHDDRYIRHYFDIEEQSATLWFLNGVFQHIGWFCQYDQSGEKPIWPT